MTKLKRQIIKPSELYQQRDNKQKRIEAMYTRERVDKIIRTEEKLNELIYSGQRDDLLRYDPVHRLIYGAAYRWGRAYRNKRIPFEDFLSVFYETAWNTIENYTWVSDFYLYETLSRDIQSRGKSLIRAAMTDKRRVMHEASELSEGFKDLYSWKDVKGF